MAARALGAAGNAPGRGTPDTKGDYDIGLDAFYNVTPALKANFTINTDFAETEVDQRRTNLTRFPLFFPEKREFFLDGANFFSFPSGEATPFFSRRIGLNAGEPQPIVFGAKLIGQIGRQDVGFLQVSTSEENLTVRGAPLQLKGEDFTVARLRRRMGSQSSAGVLYTRQRPVRLGERPGRLAVTLPVDPEARQRLVLHLDAELVGRHRARLQATRSPRRRQNRENLPLLTLRSDPGSRIPEYPLWHVCHGDRPLPPPR